MKKDLEKTFFLHFHFREDFTERGGDPLAIFQKLREFGALTVIPHTATVPLLSEYHPKRLYLKWTLKLVTAEHQSRIERVLLPLTADEKNNITLEIATLPPPDPFPQRVAFEVLDVPVRPKIEELLEKNEDFSFKRAPLPKIITNKITTSSLYMLVQIGKNIFSIHHKFIAEFIRVDPHFIKNTAEGERLEWNGSSIRVIRLHSVWRCQSTTKHISQICLVRGQLEEQSFALVVDQMIQEYYQQTQHIYENFSMLPFVSGAVALESEHTAFTLDMYEVFAKVK